MTCFSSLAEITGIAPKKPLDGKILLPLINGSVTELHADEPLFWGSGSQKNWGFARENGSLFIAQQSSSKSL